MSFWIAFLMFMCYGFAVALGRAAKDDGLAWGWQLLVALPFEVGAYLILASQVGLHW